MMENFDPWIGDAIDTDELTSACSRRLLTGRKNFDRKIAVMEIGRNLCFGGKGGGGSAPSPDPQIGAAALKNAEIGEDWLDFSKEQFAIGNIRQEAMDDLTSAVIDQQMATAEQQQEWATEDRARYKEVFQPLQDQFVETAKNYDSEERQAQVAGEAKADVLKAAGEQKQISQRQMASMGINPNSGRFQGQDKAGDLNVALSSAGAQNAARTGVRDKAIALRADAINMGAGLPAQSAAAAGLGLNAGNSATGNSNQAMGSWRANTGIMSQGFQGGMQGYANQGNILSNLYGQQVNAFGQQQQANAASAAGTGQMLGAGLGAAAAFF